MCYGNIFTKSSFSFPSRHFTSKKTVTKPKKVNLKFDNVRTNNGLILEKSVLDLRVLLGGLKECCPEETFSILKSKESVCSIGGNAKDQMLSK